MKKILTTEEIVKRCKEAHKNDDYDYSLVDYVNKDTKIKIICKKHNTIFEQLPYNHIRGNRCPICALEDRTRKTDDFIKAAKRIYGDSYTFEKTVYVTDKKKLIVTHKIIGDVLVKPGSFLDGIEPMEVSVYRKKEKLDKQLRKDAEDKWGDKYKIVYEGFLTKKAKINVICPIHGDVLMCYDTFMKYGCPQCADASFYGVNFMQFKKRAQEKFKDRFEYYEGYNGWDNEIKIKCKKHGDFTTTPQKHLLYANGGCVFCAHEKISESKTKNDFDSMVEIANKIHSNKYEYNEDSFKGHTYKFEITCPIHGKFYKTYYSHITLGQGCPKCQSSAMEQALIIKLIHRGINFVHQYKPKWLGSKKIDLFLPDYNVGIECQGSQHFYPSTLFGGNEGFKKQVESDKIKKELCEKNGVKLLYYSNLKLEFPYDVWENIDNLLNFIVYGK